MRIGTPNALRKGMTSEKKSFLLGQLQHAIDEAVSESARIGEIVEELRRSGYDLNLMLESTVSVSPIESRVHDVAPEPRPGRAGELPFTEADLDFLRQMKVVL